MSPATRADFFENVLSGKRREEGMASFADMLTKADTEAGQAYLIRRANDDWADIEKGN